MKKFVSAFIVAAGCIALSACEAPEAAPHAYNGTTENFSVDEDKENCQRANASEPCK